MNATIFFLYQSNYGETYFQPSIEKLGKLKRGLPFLNMSLHRHKKNRSKWQTLTTHSSSPVLSDSDRIQLFFGGSSCKNMVPPNKTDFCTCREVKTEPEDCSLNADKNV